LESILKSTISLLKQGFETGGLFITEWVAKPVSEMLKTIRHKDPGLALLGNNSLKSDLDSLERMVIDFANDNNPSIDASEISRQIRSGDMTIVLQEYEKEIKSPGKLVLTLLHLLSKVH
jgi:nuclear-control-of-ATPase protein 2